MKLLHPIKNCLPEFISAVLIFLFVYTAISKLIDWRTFHYSLSKSPLIGNLASFVTWMIPITEVGIVMLLSLPTMRLLGMFAAFLLFIVFTLYIGYMILFVPDLPCSCGGIIQQMSWKLHLVFNLFITVIVYAGIYIERQRRNHAASFQTADT